MVLFDFEQPAYVCDLEIRFVFELLRYGSLSVRACEGLAYYRNRVAVVSLSVTHLHTEYGTRVALHTPRLRLRRAFAPMHSSRVWVKHSGMR